MSTVVIMSLWRNDSTRHLSRRVSHLLSKKWPNHKVRWLWVVGDSTDDTESRLRELSNDRVKIVSTTTGIEGEDNDTRRIRGSVTATVLFSALATHFPDAEYACLHESDLISPDNLIASLIDATSGAAPAAGWPIINLADGPRFYDIYAYRTLDGRNFKPTPAFVNDSPFQVAGFGSVWLAPAHLVHNRVLTRLAIHDLCSQWRDEGIRMWCDPSIIIEQPTDLWEPC